MIGVVDEAGRALLALAVRPNSDAQASELIVWVDSAFDGELVIPLSAVRELSLPQSSAIQAILADGTDVVLETFGCQIEWFGERREVEVIANEGRRPLLGVGMLRDRKLIVDYRSHSLELE